MEDAVEVERASRRWHGSMKTWPEMLEDCERLLSAPPGRGVGTLDVTRHRARLEAAFRITLTKNTNGETGVEAIVGGLPGIISCVVHSVAPRLSTHWLPPDPAEQPIGVVIRCSRREDLYLFYRARDTSLVVYTLPDRSQSLVMLVPLHDDGAIRQLILAGDVCRVEFSTLEPGTYLVVSFSLVDLEALQHEALQLREEGQHSEAHA